MNNLGVLAEESVQTATSHWLAVYMVELLLMMQAMMAGPRTTQCTPHYPDITYASTELPASRGPDHLDNQKRQGRAPEDESMMHAFVKIVKATVRWLLIACHQVQSVANQNTTSTKLSVEYCAPLEGSINTVLIFLS